MCASGLERGLVARRLRHDAVAAGRMAPGLSGYKGVKKADMWLL